MNTLDTPVVEKMKTGLLRGFQKRFGVQPLLESQAAISHWFASPLGQRIVAAQRQCLDQLLPTVYGYHLMQLSVLEDILLSQQSPVTHHFSLAVRPTSHAPTIAQFEQLPIDAESIDAAILHHVLDYSPNPHQLLRETARTIIPNGYIILLGFNPFALLNAKKQLGRILSQKACWRYHSLRCRRIIDWLRVLDFEPVLVKKADYGLPVNRDCRPRLEKIGERLLPFSGSFYLIAARKSIMPVTLIKKPWTQAAAISRWAQGPAVPAPQVIHKHPATTTSNNNEQYI
ncbi:MAG: class I SAM-dependent methyltransferase [Cellvibrionaceae bacterium]|nr:class I SAM-dependent methyltransferase [Cellvibrionaceae bacterium]